MNGHWVTGNGPTLCANQNAKILPALGCMIMQKVQEFNLPKSVYDSCTTLTDRLTVSDIITCFAPGRLGLSWLLKHRTAARYEGRCFNPRARCFVTNRWLFLKKAIMIETDLNRLGGTQNYDVYFLPNQYLIWCLTNVA